MADHAIDVKRFFPEGEKNAHYIAICSCTRWRSSPFRDREIAETKGLAHSARGDTHNRAIAAADHGNVRIETTLKHYLAMAHDPFLPDDQRDQWQILADELAERLRGDGTEQTQLF